jgi:hypothetical protein
MASDIRYLTYDFVSNAFLGEVPFVGVTMSQRLNGAGSFAGALQLRDPDVRKTDPYTATAPGKTLLHVLIDGTIRWSGLITSRDYAHTSGSMSVNAVELDGILAKILQTRDYTARPQAFSNYKGTGAGTRVITYAGHTGTIWQSNPVPPIMAATKVAGDTLSDLYTGLDIVSSSALTSASILNTSVSAHLIGGYPAGTYWSEQSIPSANASTLESIFGSLSGEHITSGFDYNWSATWTSGAPAYSLDLYWPRMGVDCQTAIPGTLGSTTTGITAIDTQDLIEYSYPEDASNLATRIAGISGGTKGFRLGVGDFTVGNTYAGTGYWFAQAVQPGTPITVNASGYPTDYIGVVKHCIPAGAYGWQWKIAWSGSTPAWAATQLLDMTAVISGGPTTEGYPPFERTMSNNSVKGAKATANAAMAELATCSWPTVTPTFKVEMFGVVGITAIAVGDDVRIMLSPDERFTSGIDAYWRVTQADYQISDTGISTVTYSVDMPPNTLLTAGGFPSFQPPS